MGKRGPKPKEVINTEWNENLAYAIGLIATDGCLSSDGRHIDLTSKDLEQINNFKKCLSLSNKVGNKTSGQKNLAYRVQICSVLFYNFLTSIGLTKAKSLSLGSLDIPDLYFFDFLRGCLDGDGCSYSYWDPRWKSSYMFYICFASGSIKFINYLHSTINRLANLSGHISKCMGNKNFLYQLRYSKYEAIKLVGLMYEKSVCIKLSRKYLKIMESLDIVHKHKGWVFVK